MIFKFGSIAVVVFLTLVATAQQGGEQIKKFDDQDVDLIQ